MTEYIWHKTIRSVLECVENARDLGGYPLTDGGWTRHGAVIRCEVPIEPTDQDIAALTEGGFTAVIDLRERRTAEKVLHGLKDRVGFHYHPCAVEAGAKPAETEAEVPLIYMAIAAEEGFHQAWKVFAQAKGGVIFNCSAGRDRTGTFSMILLTHTGVCPDAVTEDYAVTKEYNRKRFAWIKEAKPWINVDVIRPRRQYAEEFLRLFFEKYGSTEAYFRSIGLNDEEIENIRTKLRGQ